jgi:cell division protein FtsB
MSDATIEQVLGLLRKQDELETEIAQLKAENEALRLQVAQVQQQIPNEPDPDLDEWHNEYCCICKLAHLGEK